MLKEVFREAGIDCGPPFLHKLFPDAYQIVWEDRCVVVYEAVVTSGVDDNKLLKYAELAYLLDFGNWGLVLVEIDRALDSRARIPEQLIRYAYAMDQESPIDEAA